MEETVEETLVTFREIAERIGMSREAVYRWYQIGKMPIPFNSPTSRPLKFRWSEVESLIDNGLLCRSKTTGDLVTVHEIADRIGVSRQAVHHWVVSGRMPLPVNPGARPLLFRMEDVRKLIDSMPASVDEIDGLTMYEVADMVGVCANTVFKWQKDGQMPAPVRHRPKMLFERGVIAEWIAGRDNDG